MIQSNRKDTKWKILESAIRAFSENGYSSVTMRDIAERVGIKASSIYNHFLSKEELLHEIYNFYEYQFHLNLPNLSKLLGEAEKGDPVQLLMDSQIRYPETVGPLMNNICRIIVGEMRHSPRAADLAVETLFHVPGQRIGKLLDRFMELGRVQSVDAKYFTLLYSNYCFAHIMRRDSGISVGENDFIAGLRLLCEKFTVSCQH